MSGVFPFLRSEKGSDTPSCGGENGLRLPRSRGRSMRNEGLSDPFPHRKRESQTLFPTTQKGKPWTSPNPLSENPLSAAHQLGVLHFCRGPPRSQSQPCWLRMSLQHKGLLRCLSRTRARTACIAIQVSQRDSSPHITRVARLQSEFSTKDFF